MTTHVQGKHHKEIAKASPSSRSVATFFRPECSPRILETESLWCKFVAEHNLAFQMSDHATKLFNRMFSDSEIAKNFHVVIKKTATIIVKSQLRTSG